MRIFSGLAIIICSVILWLLPISESVYAWKTDQRTDTFIITTGAAETTASVILVKSIYDADTGTLSFSSNDTGDLPAYSSYNTTSRQLGISGLAEETVREMDVSYDASAFTASSPFDTIGNFALYISYIVYVLFPVVGVVYIVQGVREKWFS